MSITAYLAASGFSDQLADELKDVEQQLGRLFIAKGAAQKVFWAQNIWFDAQILPIESIADAAKKLRALQKLWCCYPHQLVRRSALISEKLPFFNSAKPIPFPSPLPTTPLGSWSLLDKDTLIAAPQCSSPFAHGEVHFVEQKIGPPARAYLKLWEALTLAGKHPTAGERCLDLGASPGSWSWVLAKLGADVLAIDRSPLADNVMKFKNVTFQRGDAFSAEPEKIGAMDWLFCDVICYPEKLFTFIKAWVDSDLCKNFVCTLKFQGTEHYGAIQDFATIAGSKIMHLSHNKHELTWIKLAS